MLGREAKEEMSKAAIDVFCENLKQSHEVYYDLCPEWVAKHTLTRGIVNTGLVVGSAVTTAPKQCTALAVAGIGYVALVKMTFKGFKKAPKKVDKAEEGKEEE